jgi:hypothetical protein
MVYGAANLVCQKEQSINKQLYAQIELENSIATPSETERAYSLSKEPSLRG